MNFNKTVPLSLCVLSLVLSSSTTFSASAVGSGSGADLQAVIVDEEYCPKEGSDEGLDVVDILFDFNSEGEFDKTIDYAGLDYEAELFKQLVETEYNDFEVSEALSVFMGPPTRGPTPVPTQPVKPWNPRFPWRGRCPGWSQPGTKQPPQWRPPSPAETLPEHIPLAPRRIITPKPGWQLTDRQVCSNNARRDFNRALDNIRMRYREWIRGRTLSYHEMNELIKDAWNKYLKALAECRGSHYPSGSPRQPL